MRTLRWILALGAMAAGGLTVARRARRFDLAGKVALITGGSRGLGLVLARELGRRGVRVVLVARDAQALERARADLEGRGASGVVLAPGDVGDVAQAERAVTAALEAFGRVDVLVNLAGAIQVGPMDAMELADFERAMTTHFWGPLHLVRAVVEPMRKQGGGRIVNVSSIGGVVAPPHLLPYVASKFALTGLSLGLRAELAADGIVVTTVCPGLMRTGSPPNATFKGDRAKEYAWFATSDALPLFTASAERAARRIVRAIERGEALVATPWPARLAILAQGLAPGAVARAMALACRALPRSADRRASTGAEARPAAMPGWLTALSDRASARNNEAAP